MNRNGRKRRITMQCFEKVGLTPALLQTLLSCVVARQLGGFLMILCIVLEWLLPLRHSHAAEGSRELPWYLICCYENSEFDCSKNSFFPNSYQNPIVVLLLVDLFAGFAIIIMIFPALLS